MRALALLLSLILSSCGETEQSRSDTPARAAVPTRPSTSTAPARASEPREVPNEAPPASGGSASDSAGGAATTLESYYALIEAGRYRDAWLLRETGPTAPDATAFARNFERYRQHNAKVGAPSEPVAAGGFLYVEVPVHTYGWMKDGRSFSSAGTVTLRRARAGSSAQQWRIHTSG